MVAHCRVVSASSVKLVTSVEWTTITYNVNVNGAGGFTATVYACDNASPAATTSSISRSSNGYHAGGDLGGASPGGGNIQMHKCRPVAETVKPIPGPLGRGLLNDSITPRRGADYDPPALRLTSVAPTDSPSSCATPP